MNINDNGGWRRISLMLELNFVLISKMMPVNVFFIFTSSDIPNMYLNETCLNFAAKNHFYLFLSHRGWCVVMKSCATANKFMLDNAQNFKFNSKT